MKSLLSVLIVLLFSTSSYSQSKKSLISKNKSLEVGFGIGVLSEDIPNFYRFQIVSRDLLLNRFGLYYTYEYIDTEGGDYRDLLGLTYRLSNTFSVQAATGLTNASLFTTTGFRKELAIAYHPQKLPFTFTTGYSTTHGPTFTLNFKLFGKKKNKEIVSKENVIPPKFENTNTKKAEVPTIKNVTPTVSKEVNTTKIEKEKAPVTPTPVKTVDAKPKVNYDKLCDDNRVSNKYNSAELSDADKDKLTNFISFLKSNTNYKLKIIGRADKIGSEEYNLELGQRRADNAKKYLVSKGVNPSQLISVSIGESQSQNANTIAERALARATVFKIITP
mgnify:FL=1